MAQDLTAKRQLIISQAMQAADQLSKVYALLEDLKLERSKLDQDFQAADFTGAFVHMTAGMVGTFFDFVIPSLQTNYEDSGNVGRNEQIILQMRP